MSACRLFDIMVAVSKESWWLDVKIKDWIANVQDKAKHETEKFDMCGFTWYLWDFVSYHSISALIM